MKYIDIYSQKWANAAFLEIQSAGLNLDEFKREPWPPSIKIVHLPTKEYFVFRDENGGSHWTAPGYPGVVQNPFRSNGWDSKIPLFKAWLRSLRELLDAIAEYRSTPDLGQAFVPNSRSSSASLLLSCRTSHLRSKNRNSLPVNYKN